MPLVIKTMSAKKKKNNNNNNNNKNKILRTIKKENWENCMIWPLIFVRRNFSELLHWLKKACLCHQKWFKQFARFARVTSTECELLLLAIRADSESIRFSITSHVYLHHYCPKIWERIGEKKRYELRSIHAAYAWKNFRKICIFILSTYPHLSRHFPCPTPDSPGLRIFYSSPSQTIGFEF